MSISFKRELVTVIYYEEASLMIKHDIKEFDVNEGGRVILPEAYKEGKSIIAVCEGKVHFLNKMGDRVLPAESNEMTDSADLSFH